MRWPCVVGRVLTGLQRYFVSRTPIASQCREEVSVRVTVVEFRRVRLNATLREMQARDAGRLARSTTEGGAKLVEGRNPAQSRLGRPER